MNSKSLPQVFFENNSFLFSKIVFKVATRRRIYNLPILIKFQHSFALIKTNSNDKKTSYINNFSILKFLLFLYKTIFFLPQTMKYLKKHRTYYTTDSNAY